MASPALADQSITFTGTGTNSDGALSASAAFAVTTGQIRITLSNTLALSSFISSGQTISDLHFTLSNAPGTLLATSTATGQQGNISSTGVVTTVAGNPGRFLGIGGGSFTVSANTVAMEALGGGMPSELITPTPPANNTFPNTNPGITSQNPYTIGPATFVLNLTGVTSLTTVTAASFSFGTNPDAPLIPGTPMNPVPEPSTIAFAISALPLGLGLWLRRRKARLA
jgi:hypothetical protein